MMNSSIPEHEHEGRDIDNDDYYDEPETFSGTGCCCFWRNAGGERRRLVQQQQQQQQQSNGSEQRENWLNEKLNELKEVSEIVAGPKWKNFIRRFGKYWKKNENKKGKTTAFQYDLEGYALNFDRGEEDEEEERLMVDFSSRFAPPVSGEINKERGGL